MGLKFETQSIYFSLFKLAKDEARNKLVEHVRVKRKSIKALTIEQKSGTITTIIKLPLRPRN